MNANASATPAFLYNAWYVAAFATEVTRKPFRRTLLDEHIAFFRTEAGEPAALYDRCPHRFVPLSGGIMRGDDIQCPYHGLRFDRFGNCVLNPHGSGDIPKRARVRSYPLVERYSFIWIWMGDAELADAGRIPDFSPLADDEHHRRISGYVHEQANYQLITDNLLDLTHSEFLHPAFAKPAGPQSARNELNREGDTIYANRWMQATEPTAFLRSLWDSPSAIGDARANMRWDAPATHFLDLGVTEVGGRHEDGVSIPTAHIVTPETERSSHYFWVMARNRRLDDRELDAQMQKMGDYVFENEDKPAVESQQRAMGTSTDLLAELPIFLEGDAAATLARRILTAKIKGDPAAAAHETAAR